MDVGCGRGACSEDPLTFRRQLRTLKGKCQKVIGIDVDPVAQDNPFLDEFIRILGDSWPLPDGSIDLCIADNVLEHLENPDFFFFECHRVLKPDGFVCIRTPNVLSYFGLIVRLIPNKQRVQVLERAKDRVRNEDVFPTFYRCNTVFKIRRMLSKFHFDSSVYGYEAEPSYFSFSRLAYSLGVLHQRFAPNLIKVGIHAFGKKQNA